MKTHPRLALQTSGVAPMHMFRMHRPALPSHKQPVPETQDACGRYMHEADMQRPGEAGFFVEPSQANAPPSYLHCEHLKRERAAGRATQPKLGHWSACGQVGIADPFQTHDAWIWQSVGFDSQLHGTMLFLVMPSARPMLVVGSQNVFRTDDSIWSMVL